MAVTRGCSRNRGHIDGGNSDRGVAEAPVAVAMTMAMAVEETAGQQ